MLAKNKKFEGTPNPKLFEMDESTSGKILKTTEIAEAPSHQNACFSLSFSLRNICKIKINTATEVAIVRKYRKFKT